MSAPAGTPSVAGREGETEMKDDAQKQINELNVERARLKTELQRERTLNKELQAMLRSMGDAGKVRAQWGSVAIKLISQLDKASATLPTLSQVRYLNEGEWVLLGGVRDRLQALDQRLAQLEARRSDARVVDAGA